MKRTKYLRDEDGNVKVVFMDGTKKVPFSLSKSPNTGFRILLEYKKLADEGKLTRKILLDMETTDMLRLATYPPASKPIEDILGFRGLPLKDKLPDGKKIRLLPHQVQALAWLRQRESMDHNKIHGLRGGIVNLTQGLGKSLTALALIITSPKGVFPSLIVSSKTVMAEWKTQGVEKFFGSNIKALYFHRDFISNKIIDTISRNEIKTYDVVFTTYDVILAVCRKYKYHEQTYEIGEDNTLMKGKKISVHHRTRIQCDNPKVKGPAILFCTPWERVICDESQRFANYKTSCYESIMALYGERMWCLTGTPCRNTELDIWAQFRFCGYTGVVYSTEWKKKSYATFQQHKLNEAIFSMDYKDAKIILPPKTEYVILVPLTGNHKIFYDWVLGETIVAYDDMMRGRLDFACVLAWFTALRQTAIAPYLFTSQSKRTKTIGKAKKHKDEMMEKIKKRFENSEMYKWLIDKNTDSGINSVKIKEIVDIISKIPKGEKVLVFSMFTSCTDLVAEAVKAKIPDYHYIQVDGDVTGEERTKLINKFRTDPGVSGLFMTYKVGSEGLNLVEATHCICIEPWWTDAVHRQAKARCWRMGQTREVHVHNIYVENSIEERVTEICKSKNEMTAAFLEGTEKKIRKTEGLTKATLGKILGIK